MVSTIYLIFEVLKITFKSKIIKIYEPVVATSPWINILEARVWKRNIVESVEATLTNYEGRKISLCIEPQGEALAIKHNCKGFYTISEATGEDKPTENISIPVYYYLLSGRQQNEIK